VRTIFPAIKDLKKRKKDQVLKNTNPVLSNAI